MNGQEGREMVMLWANRRREEVVGDGGADSVLAGEGNEMVAMVGDLERKAEAVADLRVRTKYFVDEENRFIQRKDLEDALQIFKSEKAGLKTIADQDGERQKHDRLILLSGPDGFVEYFAGLRNGVEVTGLTGGLLGQMKLEGWTVVRL